MSIHFLKSICETPKEAEKLQHALVSLFGSPSSSPVVDSTGKSRREIACGIVLVCEGRAITGTNEESNLRLSAFMFGWDASACVERL